MTDRLSKTDREARVLRVLLGLGCLPFILLPFIIAVLVINAASQPIPTPTPSWTPFLRTPPYPTLNIAATAQFIVTASVPSPPTFAMPGQIPATPTPPPTTAMATAVTVP